MSAEARSRIAWRGFALLELLVALAIFSVIAVVAYRGIASVTQARATLDGHSERLKSIQLAVGIIERDLRQAASRPVRGSYGEVLPALAGLRGGVELTCYGFSGGSNEARSLLERVAYAYADGELVRVRYPVLDRAPQTQASRRPLLDGVAGLRLRYLDPGGRWVDAWPTADRAADPYALPRAVEVSLPLEDFGEIRRVVELVDVPPAVAAGAP